MKCPFPDLFIPGDISFYDFVFEKVNKFLDKTAIVDVVSGEEVTFRTLQARIESVSAALARRHGCVRGDTLAIVSTNSIEFVVICFGASRAGMRVALINPLNPPKNLVEQLQETNSKVLYASSELMDNVKEALKSCTVVKAVYSDKEYGDCLGIQSMYAEDASSFRSPPVKPRHDVALLPFSSGTTGKAKAVMLTHFNLVANVTQRRSPHLDHNLQNHPEEQTTDLLIVPQFHMFGASITFWALRAGNRLLLCGARFQPEVFLAALQDYKVKFVFIVPPICVMLAKSPMVDKYNLSNLQELISGAAPLAQEMEEQLKKRLKLKSIGQVWGMTEITTIGIMNPIQHPRAGSVGIPTTNTQVQIVDESGNTLGPNKSGEVCIKGPQVMKGYLKNPKATAETIRNGWLYTGDIGYYDDDGYLYVVDRLKELIKYKGYQVPPSELEALLLEHPDVADAGIIGKPDLEAGELPLAFIVRKYGTTVTEEQIKQFVDSQVAPYKKLRGGVRFVDQIPKSASGKIIRRMMKEMLKQTTSKL